jgi:hypothetical protein
MALGLAAAGGFQQAHSGRRQGRGAGACRRGSEPVLGVRGKMAHRRLAPHGDSTWPEGNGDDGSEKGSRKLARWLVRSMEWVQSSQRWRRGRRMAGVAHPLGGALQMKKKAADSATSGLAVTQLDAEAPLGVGGARRSAQWLIGGSAW